ncbi:MAG: hypothetical protein ABL907_05295 [Hyphomicrobium sp.]
MAGPLAAPSPKFAACCTSPSSRGERVYEGFHIQNVNAYAARLKDWMRAFKGVASKHLPNYIGWRRSIERDGDRLTPRHLIAEAIGA